MPKFFLNLLIAMLFGVVPSGRANEINSDFQKVQKLVADKSHPITWVFTGDSITHGAKHTRGSRSYVEHFAERDRWELRRVNDVVVNTGISGDKADGILRAFDWRVARFKPEVVSIMIGMNDCTRGPARRDEFRKNLVELIQRVRGLGAIPVIHTMNTVESSTSAERGDLPNYIAVIRDVARQEKTILVDHWKYWNAACDTPEKLREWLNDPIHPNARGHRELAILTFKALGIFDAKSPTCQPAPE